MAKAEVVDAVTGEVLDVPVRTVRFARERKRVQKVFVKPSKAKQSFKDECDINGIMKRYQVTGVLDHVRSVQARYLDATVIPDFAESMFRVADAMSSGEELFMSLPPEVRKEFRNDVRNFLGFAADPANEAYLKELGILPAPEPLKSPQSGDPQSGGVEGVDPLNPSPEAAKASGGAV